MKGLFPGEPEKPSGTRPHRLSAAERGSGIRATVAVAYVVGLPGLMLIRSGDWAPWFTSPTEPQPQMPGFWLVLLLPLGFVPVALLERRRAGWGLALAGPFLMTVAWLQTPASTCPTSAVMTEGVCGGEVAAIEVLVVFLLLAVGGGLLAEVARLLDWLLARF